MVEVIIVHPPAIRRLAILILTGAVLTFTGSASAAPIGTSFTYQAILTDPGGPVTGIRDLRLTLYDAAASGAVVAGPLALDDVTATNGRVMLELDFGDVFDDADSWLSIEVRDGASNGAYTVLHPRRRLRPAPYVAHALESDTAVIADNVPTAGDADTLDGQHGAFYRAWSNITGVPFGLDDGDNDVIGDLACTTGEVATWNGSAWACDTDEGAAYVRTVVVQATADPLVNGSALITAVDAISEPTSQEEAWSVRLEPGRYDLGVEYLNMKPWMVLEGSGQGTTLVTSARCDPSGVPIGTIIGESDTEIRDLTVENTCAANPASSTAVAFGWGAVRGRLTRVTARVTSGTERCAAVLMYGDDAILDRVTAQAHGCPVRNTGIATEGDGTLILDCVASATGGGIHTALRVAGQSRVSRGSFSADDDPSAGDSAITITGDVEIADVDVHSDGDAVRISAWDDITVTMSRMSVRGPVDVYVGTGFSVALLIEHSRIESPGTTVSGYAGATIAIAATQLAGDPVLPSSGTVACAGVWDESWIFYPNTCP